MYDPSDYEVLENKFNNIIQNRKIDKLGNAANNKRMTREEQFYIM